jgi:hypothetical protein
MIERNLTIGAVVLLSLFLGCKQLQYTADGVPIVPFGAVHSGDGTIAVGDAQVEVTTECWLNFMPGPRTDTAGRPLHIALRVAVVRTDSEATAAHFEALTLWSETGDSMLTSFGLVNTSNGKAEVALHRVGTTELTNNPQSPRRVSVQPGTPCAPRLLISRNGTQQLVSLPDIVVQAVY